GTPSSESKSYTIIFFFGVSAKYIKRPSGLNASELGMVIPLNQPWYFPPCATLYRVPVGRRSPSFMLPTQNRPCRSHFPSFKRLLDNVGSGSKQSSVVQECMSYRYRPDFMASTIPPTSRSQKLPTISGSGCVFTSPSVGS